MAINKETIKYVADLSRIELTDEELERFSSQLQEVVGFIDQLNKADITGVSPTSHILPLNNVLREDRLTGSLPNEDALSNAPQKKDGFFVVPKVIE